MSQTQPTIISTIPSEQAAYAAVQAIGVAGAQKEIEAIGEAARSKAQALCGDNFENMPFGFTIRDYMDEGQLERLHTLTLGLSLSEPSPAAAARQRIEARKAALRASRTAGRRSTH